MYINSWNLMNFEELFHSCVQWPNPIYMKHFYFTKVFLYISWGDLNEIVPIGSDIWALGLHLVVLFGDLVKPLEMEPCWRKYITGDLLWVFSLTLLPRLFLWLHAWIWRHELSASRPYCLPCLPLTLLCPSHDGLSPF